MIGAYEPVALGVSIEISPESQSASENECLRVMSYFGGPGVYKIRNPTKKVHVPF